MTLAEHFNRVCAAYSKCLKPRFGELGFQAARPLEGILVSMLCHMLQITLQYVITIHPSHAACGGLFFSGVGFCSVAASSICFNFQLTFNIQSACTLSPLLGSLGSPCPGDKARHLEDVGSAKLLHRALDHAVVIDQH